MCLNPKLMVNPTVWRYFGKQDKFVFDGRVVPPGTSISLKSVYECFNGPSSNGSTQKRRYTVMPRKRVYELVDNTYLIVRGRRINVYFAACCNHCRECLFFKQEELAKRCMFEAQTSPYMYWFTLTYDCDHLPNNGYLCKNDVVSALKRFRSNVKLATIKPVNTYKTKTKFLPNGEKEFIVTEYKASLSYNYTFRCFYVGEYGGDSFRPHYHGVMFLNRRLSYDDYYNFKNLLRSSWGKGIVFDFDIVHTPQAACKYVTKYLSKQLCSPYRPDDPDFVPPFIQTPRKCGLGAPFLEDAENYDLIKNCDGSIYLTFLNYDKENNQYTKVSSLVSIPKFLIDKIYPSPSRIAPKLSAAIKDLQLIRDISLDPLGLPGPVSSEIDDEFSSLIDSTLEHFRPLIATMKKAQHSNLQYLTVDGNITSDRELLIQEYVSWSSSMRREYIRTCLHYLWNVVPPLDQIESTLFEKLDYLNRCSNKRPCLSVDRRFDDNEARVFYNYNYIQSKMIKFEDFC